MSDLLTGHLPPVTYDEMEAELLREIKARAFVYPRQVHAKKLKQSTSDYRIRVMTAVLQMVKDAKRLEVRGEAMR